MTAPMALMLRRQRQPFTRSRSQWRTMPPWLRVKAMKTPTE